MIYNLTILGEKWTLKAVKESEDSNLKNKDGYADKTTRTIGVLGEPTEGSDLGDFAQYVKKVKRHEIIHAYLFESGLHENFVHPEFGHDETFVDWVAVQFPKMIKTFKEADAL